MENTFVSQKVKVERSNPIAVKQKNQPIVADSFMLYLGHIDPDHYRTCREKKRMVQLAR